MDKALLAELILSMVTGRERASSTAGDLMEEVPARGIFWFWSSVCRTVLSLLWQDFAAEPAFLAGLGFRGFIVSMALLLALMLILSVIFGIFAVVFGIKPDALAWAPVRWAVELAGALPVVGIQFQVGRWIARRAHGRELAACVAFLIVNTAVSVVIGEAAESLLAHLGHSGAALQSEVQTPDVQISGLAMIIWNLIGGISLFGGAVSVRRRFMEAAP